MARRARLSPDTGARLLLRCASILVLCMIAVAAVTNLH